MYTERKQKIKVGQNVYYISKSLHFTISLAHRKKIKNKLTTCYYQIFLVNIVVSGVFHLWNIGLFGKKKNILFET